MGLMESYSSEFESWLRLLQALWFRTLPLNAIICNIDFCENKMTVNFKMSGKNGKIRNLYMVLFCKNKTNYVDVATYIKISWDLFSWVLRFLFLLSKRMQKWAELGGGCWNRETAGKGWKRTWKESRGREWVSSAEWVSSLKWLSFLSCCCEEGGL